MCSSDLLPQRRRRWHQAGAGRQGGAVLEQHAAAQGLQRGLVGQAFQLHPIGFFHLESRVEGAPEEAALQALRQGVTLNDGPTRPARVCLLEPAPVLWQREPPIRVRQAIPTAWLELVIREGRNRQVRRMTAAVGLPTLRLVRVAIGPYTLDGLAPGAWRVVSAGSTGCAG